MDRSYQRPAGGSSSRRAGAATTASPLQTPAEQGLLGGLDQARHRVDRLRIGGEAERDGHATDGRELATTTDLRMRPATTSASARSAAGRRTPNPCGPTRAARS
jgi:hypothetical protein